MTCKVNELIVKLKIKEQSARSKRSVYTAAISQITAMANERKAKDEDLVKKATLKTSVSEDMDDLTEEETLALERILDSKHDDNYVAEGPIQFSIDKSAIDRLSDDPTILFELTVKAISPEISHLVDAGKIELHSSDSIQEMIGENSDKYSYSIVGENARQARKMGLATAQKMFEEGSMPDEVQKATGWYLDKDAKWKFALNSTPKATPLLSKLEAGKEYMLKDLISYKELFDNYPGLSTLKVKVVKSKALGKASGQYNVMTNTITLPNYSADMAMGKSQDVVNKGRLSTLGHEVQHAIQEIENFAKGGNLDTAKSHVMFRYLEKLRKLYESVVEEIRPEVGELLETAANGTKEEKEAAAKEIRDKVTAKATMLMKVMFKYDNSQTEKATAYAKKFKLHTATPEQLAYMVYFHLLGEVEARTAGAMWVGETYDTGSYENIVHRLEHPTSASIVQALYNKETKQVILNEEVLTDDKVEGVVYHEVGVHMYADVIRSNELLQDKAVKLLERGLKSSNAGVKGFFVGVSKRLEEAKEVGNKEEVLAYLVEEGFNTLENHELFNPEDRLDQALSKMRKILPAVVVDLITEVVKAFVGKMEKLTKKNVDKVKMLAGKGLTGLTYDLGLQADYNQIINLVRKGTKEIADKYEAIPEEVVNDKWTLLGREFLAKLRSADKSAADRLEEYQIESTYPIYNAVLMEEIKQKLATMYPEIEVNAVDSLFSTDGAEVVGRAIDGIVTYNPNKAGLDTLPHEYAHVYINLLEKTTFMGNLISKIQQKEKLDRPQAKEWLADYIGVRYADNITGLRNDLSKEELSLISKVWLAIKKMFNRKEEELKSDLLEMFKRFYQGDNAKAIRFTPQDGYSLINIENTLSNQPFASNVLESVIKLDSNAALTGSVALGAQGEVYRKGDSGVVDLHDLDIQLGDISNKEKEAIAKALGKKYNITKIYDFGMPKTKEGHDIVSELGKYVPKSARKLAVGISKLLFSTKVASYIVTPPGVMVTDMVRYKNGDSASRVESYTLTKNGVVVGTYKADIELDGEHKTKIVAEHFTGEKAVVLDLISGNNQPSIDYYSSYLDKTIKISSAESIIDAKNAMGSKPRDKDVMDINFFKPIPLPKKPEAPMNIKSFSGDNGVATVYNNLTENCK